MKNVFSPLRNEQLLARLRELVPLAAKVRRGASAEVRQPAEEFAFLLHIALTVEGASSKALANQIGITRAAIDHRLVRYGYKTSASTSKVYRQIPAKDRVAVEPIDE